MASESGLPTSAFSRLPKRVSAERLTRITVPSGSTPTTPAVTPESTASMNRLRSSSAVLAPMRASLWLFSSEVMTLKV
jgi:hypothetical protein